MKNNTNINEENVLLETKEDFTINNNSSNYVVRENKNDEGLKEEEKNGEHIDII